MAWYLKCAWGRATYPRILPKFLQNGSERFRGAPHPDPGGEEQRTLDPGSGQNHHGSPSKFTSSAGAFAFGATAFGLALGGPSLAFAGTALETDSNA